MAVIWALSFGVGVFWQLLFYKQQSSIVSSLSPSRIFKNTCLEPKQSLHNRTV